MAKKKVRVLSAIVGGKKQGDVLDVEEKTAEMLVANRYVEYVKAESKSADSGDKKPEGDSAKK